MGTAIVEHPETGLGAGDRQCAPPGNDGGDTPHAQLAGVDLDPLVIVDGGLVGHGAPFESAATQPSDGR